jgi:FKBP-type peptidyl-prolyl cis-trans isomerase SlyD
MTSHAESTGPLASGDLVLLDYELWAESGAGSELVDTTREEVAQKAEVKPSEGQSFGPHPHLIGGDFFPGGIENALLGAKVGQVLDKEFAPAEAFGERDPKLIELFGMHEIARLPEMRREDAHLDVGTILTIKGRRGRVTTLTAARVRVDFNPAFAGRKIRANFKILERVVDPAAQVKALVELSYGRSNEFHVEVHGASVSLKIPDRAKFDFAWLASKPRLVDRIRTQLKPEKITFSEEYITPVKKEEPAAKPSAGEGPTAATEKPKGTRAHESTHEEAADAPHPAEPSHDKGKTPHPPKSS